MISPRFIWGLFAPLSLYAIFATVKQAIDLATNGTSSLGTLAGAGVVLAVVILLLRDAKWLANISNSIANTVSTVPPRHWIAGCLLAGVVTRIVWVLLFPPVFVSDFKSYWQLANRLVDQGNFYIARTYAYWPPGLPFSLVPSLLALGSHPWVPFVNNLLLFGGTLIVVYFLAATVSDEIVARVATILLALWPNFIFYAGLPGKELLLAFLLPLAILLYLSCAAPDARSSRPIFALLTGLVLGFATLTQASVILYPSVLIIYEIIRRTAVRTLLSRISLVILGIVLMVSPWTVRNYFVLDTFVPVSTNGGWSFYAGNNPKATGGYVALEADFADYDEVTASKLAFSRGKSWIKENPLKFAELAIKKNLIFLGEDSDGVFWTVKRGWGIDDFRYAMLKALSNLFWIGIFVLSLVSLRLRWESLSNFPEIALLTLGFLYFFAIHSVFESGSRHHVAMIGCLAILAALAFDLRPMKAINSCNTRPDNTEPTV